MAVGLLARRDDGGLHVMELRIVEDRIAAAGGGVETKDAAGAGVLGGTAGDEQLVAPQRRGIEVAVCGVGGERPVGDVRAAVLDGGELAGTVFFSTSMLTLRT